MADATTPNYGWSYPTNGADDSTWGSTLNATLLAIDAALHAQAVGSVSSVAGRSGAVTLAKADITDAGTGIGTDIVISGSAPSGTPTKPTVWFVV